MYAHVNVEGDGAAVAGRGSAMRGRVHNNNNNVLLARQEEEMNVSASHRGSPARGGGVAGVATTRPAPTAHHTEEEQEDSNNNNNSSIVNSINMDHIGDGEQEEEDVTSIRERDGAHDDSLLENGLPQGFWSTTFLLLVALPADATLLIAPMVSGTMGYGSDLIVFVVLALIMTYSYRLLGLACARSGARSWEEAAASLVSAEGARLVGVALVFCQWMSCTLSVEVMFELFYPLFMHKRRNGYWPFGDWTVIATVLVWFGGMLLPSFLPHMPSIRLLAVVKVGLLIFGAVAAVFATVRDHHRLPALKPRAFSAQASWMSALAAAVMIPSVMAQYCVFDAYKAMPRPSVGKLTGAAGGSMVVLAIFHFVVGLVVYFFYGDTSSVLDVFQYYLETSNVVKAACIALIIESCVSYVIFMHGVTRSMGYLIHRRHHGSSYRERLIIAFVASVLAVVAGIFIFFYPLFYTLVGTLGGGVLVFLMPALLAQRATKLTQHRFAALERVLYVIFCILGVVAFLLCLFGVCITIMYIVYVAVINGHPPMD